jgi:hypothetical protein
MPGKGLKKQSKLSAAASPTVVRATRRPGAGSKTSAGPSRRRARAAAFEKEYRPLVRRLVAEELEDAMDAFVSRLALKDPERISHDEVWKRLGV